MTQLGEAIAVTTIVDPDRPHWVIVEYKYANGRPVKGRFVATDSEGMTWAGTLNDQGEACLSGLPPGSVEFELVSEDIDDELARTRADIKAVLDAIIAEQRAEAAQHEAELAQQSALEQAGSHYGAYVTGIWNGAVGLVTFAKDVVVKTAEIAVYLSPFERLSNALHAAYTSYHDGELTSAQWKQSFIQNMQDEEIQDIARILGIDPSHLSAEGLQNLTKIFAEAYEITAFIADDPESLDMLVQFGKDYAGAQSSIEWAEFAGGGVFEIVLTALLLMFTGGIGNVAQGVSKIRHAGKLKSLGSIFRNLGKLLKRKKLRRNLSGDTDQRHTVTTEVPPDRRNSTPLTNHQKAAIGERTAHDKMVADGYEPLGNTNGTYSPGQTGIDGVYRHPNPPPDYVITEAKYGTARLGNTADGTQMSDSWVMGSDRSEKAGLSPTDLNAIKEGLEFGDGTVGKILIRVNPDGSASTSIIP